MSCSSRVTALAHAACDWRCARAAVCCVLVASPWSPCMRSHCRKSHWVPSSAFRGGMIDLDSEQKASHQWRRVRSGTPAVFASVVNQIFFAIGQIPLEGYIARIYHAEGFVVMDATPAEHGKRECPVTDAYPF